MAFQDGEGWTPGTTQRVSASMLRYSPLNGNYLNLGTSGISTTGLDSVISLENIDISVSSKPNDLSQTVYNFYDTGLTESRFGNPDFSSVDPNHSIIWDGTGRLHIVSSGLGGTSWFEWPYSRTKVSGYNNFITLSGVTAPGTSVRFSRDSGSDYTPTIATGDGTSITYANTNSNTSIASLGIKITTTGAGDVYVDRWCHLDLVYYVYP